MSALDLALLALIGLILVPALRKVLRSRGGCSCGCGGCGGDCASCRSGCGKKPEEKE